MKLSRIPQQIIPLGILFAAAIIGLVVLRAIFVPPTFGEHGHYRAAAVDEISQLPESYAGIKACMDCHSDVYDLKQASVHKGLSCETCHGAAAAHAADPEAAKPVVPTGRNLCLTCHGYLDSRPSGFPQIISATHNPAKPCMSCHNPHSPIISAPTEECAACHAGIANQKAVSHHAELACTQCHTVPKEHFTQPRVFAAQKPAGREVCGACHANAGSGKEIPQIDLATHGGRYMCWDCHYPHSPEAQ
ncbi:hypothetical protein C3F09_10460 [candidate division GN15 bacterium]|uniref:Tetrahaem cytochrome domain-containing protein n=1 Tax=candidate division GN15 bacterium TaxID=2072418 RepID=A0A855X359_9BACT|nr:MAG: hypothetical protein C3F09_10460 [candidate division GN15 bacterium]